MKTKIEIVVIVDDSTARGIATKQELTSILAKLAAFANRDECRVDVYEDGHIRMFEGRMIG